MNETELQVVKAELQGMISAWIVDALAHPLVPVSKAEVEQIPRIDLAGLEELPWTSFQTKQPACMHACMEEKVKNCAEKI